LALGNEIAERGARLHVDFNMADEQESSVRDENTIDREQPAQEAEPQPEEQGPSAEGSQIRELADANDRYTRLVAEFDNYKKRTAKEKVDLIQSAGKNILVKLLPVLDDFDRALVAIRTAQDVGSVKEGIELVGQKFRSTLVREGLQEMEGLIGQPFDAECQEAATAIPAPSEDLKSKVIDVLEKGYLLNGKVIRYAKVVIGQ